eukprot:11510083-Karenia_brevis.AAC.1
MRHQQVNVEKQNKRICDAGHAYEPSPSPVEGAECETGVTQNGPRNEEHKHTIFPRAWCRSG